MYQIDKVRAVVGSARPQITSGFSVEIDGLPMTPYFGAEISTSHDANAAFSTATFPLLRRLSLDPTLRHKIVYKVGWQGDQYVAFVGEIVSHGKGMWEPREQLQAGGVLRRLEVGLSYLKNTTDYSEVMCFYNINSANQVDLDAQMADNGAADSLQKIPIETDADIIVKILEMYGITVTNWGHWIEASPPWAVDTFPGPAYLSPIVWSTADPGWQIIQELDRCTTYRTFDGRDGVVRRVPALGTVPGAKHTFERGEDILGFSIDTSYDVYNRVWVRGGPIKSLDGTIDPAEEGNIVVGVAPIGGPVPTDLIPTPPGVRTDESLNSGYIETVEEAEHMADVLLGYLANPLQTINLETFGCSDFDVGDGVHVSVPNLADFNCFVETHNLTGSPLRSQFVLRGSSLATARPNQPPTPQLVVSLALERLILP